MLIKDKYYESIVVAVTLDNLITLQYPDSTVGDYMSQHEWPYWESDL